MCNIPILHFAPVGVIISTEREVRDMARGLYKKVARTQFAGQASCGGGGRWVERVRSDRSANKALRKMKKI